MNAVRYISFITLLLLLTACGASKKVHTEKESKSQDTVVRQVVQQSASSSNKVTKTTLRDTVIKVQERIVHDTIHAEDKEIPQTPSGKKMPRHFEKSENGLTVWVDLQPDGNITYGGRADSLLLVVRNLERTADSLIQASSNIKSDSTYHGHSEANTEITVMKKVRAFLGGLGWLFLVISLICGCVVGWYVHKLLS